MSDNPRAVIGANKPPLAGPDEIAARIEREHAALFTEAANLEAALFALPQSPANDEELASVTEFILKVKALARRAEEVRTEEGRPYLDATKILNDLFKELSGPCAKMVKDMTDVVGVYSRAKAERERAERLERERLEREAAEAARRREEEARRVAEEQQRLAEEAAARIRIAADHEARAVAEQQMREADAASAAARRAAEHAADEGSKSERRADANARAADGDVGKLSRISAGGATSSTTLGWVSHITDADTLMKSLGPLGAYLSNDTIQQAIKRALREHASADTVAQLKLPGVTFTKETRVNVRAVR